MDGKLDGWKEIASHLDKSVKTAQRWEQQHGMPVHRIAGDASTNASVFAFRAELDDWLREQAVWAASEPGNGGPEAEQKRSSGNGRGTGRPSDPTRWNRARSALALLAVLLVVAVVVVGAALVWTAPRAGSANPADAAIIDDHRLVVHDAEGSPLWERQFDEPTEPIIRGHTYRTGAPAWRVHDIDGDGLNEVLLVRNRPEDMGLLREVTCFDAEGEIRWRRHVGRDLRIDGEDHPNQFTVGPLAIGRLAGGGIFMVTVANHRPFSPSQVLVLDADGETLGEYWNDGYTLGIRTEDVDDDGTDEIFLGGINEAVRRPFVALIEHDIAPTFAPGPAAVPDDLERGNEVAYVTLPRTRVADALGFKAWVGGFREYGERVIVDVWMSGGVEPHDIKERVYVFDRDLRPEKLTLSNGLRPYHNSMLREGTISESLEEEMDRLLEVERHTSRGSSNRLADGHRVER